jgi:hypothetical protein
MSGHNQTLIAKITVQSLLQQLQQAEILLTFDDVRDVELCLTLKEHMTKIRTQLNNLEYRLQKQVV